MLLDPAGDHDPLDWTGYADLRERMRDRTGRDESVVVVEGPVVDGVTRLVAIVWEFGFLGGSMGTAAGQRIAAAYDHARRRGLPVLLLPATGGARMQEGMASLVQMAATSAAAAAHREAGLLQIAVLRNPTTGGPFASHVNQADVLFAEPGATIGFAGPRVASTLGGGALPPGSHTSRGAFDHGLIDAVIARPDLPGVIERALAWGTPRVAPTDLVHPRPSAPSRRRSAWDEVQASRATGRPRATEFLQQTAIAVELSGDRGGHRDPAIRVALTTRGHRRLVVIAMDAADGLAITSAGFRTAWRGLALAASMGVPVVTLIDTPGADASATSEAEGIAAHISATFSRLLSLSTPVVSLVIGEGGSGGALALAVADRLLIQEHATFSVIAPEGASTILHRRPDRADEVAELLQPTSHQLAALGIADEVVPEDDVEDAVATAWLAIERHLDELLATGAGTVEHRRDRWRRAGT